MAHTTKCILDIYRDKRTEKTISLGMILEDVGRICCRHAVDRQLYRQSVVRGCMYVLGNFTDRRFLSISREMIYTACLTSVIMYYTAK